MILLETPAPEFVKRFQSGETPNSAHVTVTYEPTEQTEAPAIDGDIPDSWRNAFGQK